MANLPKSRRETSLAVKTSSFEDLLVHVKLGSEAHIEYLIDNWPKDPSSMWDAFRALAVHLDVPSAASPSVGYDQARLRAISACRQLALLLTGTFYSPLSSVIAPFIISKLDAVLRWCCEGETVVQFQGFSIPTLMGILAGEGYYKPLQIAAMARPITKQLFMSALAHDYTTLPKASQVNVRGLWASLQHPSLRNAVLKKFYEGSDGDRFTEAVVKNAVAKMASLHAEMEMVMGAAQARRSRAEVEDSALTTRHGTIFFVLDWLNCDAKARRYLLKEDYIRRYTSFAIACLKLLPVRQHHRARLEICLSACGVLKWTARHEHHKVRLLVETLDAGGLSFAVEALNDVTSPYAGARLSADQFDTFIRFIPYLASARVRKATRRALASVPLLVLRKLDSPNYPEAHRFWQELDWRITTHEVVGARCKENFHALCQNINHHSRGGEHKGKSLYCVGCRSVVYCSTECQRQDWEQGHRWECASFEQDRQELEHNGLWIPHRARHHAILMADSLIFSEKSPPFLQQVMKTASTDNPRCRGYHPKDLVYILGWTTSGTCSFPKNAADAAMPIAFYQQLTSQKTWQWSERRWGRLNAFVQARGDSCRLIALGVSFGTSMLRVLLVGQISGDARSVELLTGPMMIHIDHTPQPLPVPDCRDACCR